MKKIDVRDAVGMKLCHDITEMRDGFKGVAFKRNAVIRDEDVETFDREFPEKEKQRLPGQLFDT